VELDSDECKRLDTPKPERPWVVVQANQVKDSLDLTVCPMTGTLNEKKVLKKQLSSFVLVKGTELLSNKTEPWRKDSFVKCGRVCTVLSTKVKYVGFLLPETMVRIDEKLRFCLDLKPEKPQPKPSYRLVRDLRRKAKKA
jgi:mRNA-degrading endonuclease toxin of MazEF toxin-antitoxin module